MSSSEQFSVADCPMDTLFVSPSHILIGTSRVPEVLTAPDVKSTDEKREAMMVIMSPSLTSFEDWITQSEVNGIE